MGSYGLPRIPMESYGFLWIAMDPYGILWTPVDSNGFLWIPITGDANNTPTPLKAIQNSRFSLFEKSRLRPHTRLGKWIQNAEILRFWPLQNLHFPLRL